jgi:hypothetical protein
MGRSGKMRSRLCESCTETEAWAMLARGYYNRKRTRWVENGVMMRRCVCCPYRGPEAEGFYVCRRVPRLEYNSRCKSCSVAQTRAYKRERRARDPEYRERMTKLSRSWRQANAEKARAASARWKLAIKKDPVEHARQLELARINYRLRRERLGLPVRPVGRRPQPARKHATAPGLLPAAPLAALIERIYEKRMAVAGLVEDPAPTRQAVCGDLGVSERNARVWRKDPEAVVQVGTAERVLLNAGVDWHEIYSFDDYAEHFLADEDSSAPSVIPSVAQPKSRRGVRGV